MKLRSFLFGLGRLKWHRKLNHVRNIESASTGRKVELCWMHKIL
jgi:hypothetical protein